MPGVRMYRLFSMEYTALPRMVSMTSRCGGVWVFPLIRDQRAWRGWAMGARVEWPNVAAQRQVEVSAICFRIAGESRREKSKREVVVVIGK